MREKLKYSSELEIGTVEELMLKVLSVSSMSGPNQSYSASLKKLLHFIQNLFEANESWLFEEQNTGTALKYDLQNLAFKDAVPIHPDFQSTHEESFFTLEIEKPFLYYKYHLIFPFNLNNKKYWVGFSRKNSFRTGEFPNYFLNFLAERLKELVFQLVNNEKQQQEKLSTILNQLPQAIVFTEKDSGEAWLNKEALKIFDLDPLTNTLSSDLFETKLVQLKSKVTNKEEVELVGNNMITLGAFPSSFGDDWIWKFENKVLKVIRKKAKVANKLGELWVFDNVSELYFANERLNALFRTLNVAYDEINANLTEFQSKSSGKKSIIDLEAEESKIIQQYDNNDILGKVTHDLRTPFAKVYTIVQLLLTDNQENLSSQQIERIGLIKQVVADGLQIVKGFLDTGNMVLDDKKFHPEVMDVEHFVESSLMPYELLSAKKNIIFITQIMEKDLKVEVDKIYLRRIIDNLVSNAIKFSPFETTINYTIIKEKNEIIFSVKDQGPGLTDNDKERLFKKYQQLSAKPIGTDESTGLGLYIVKTMVDKLGGRIWVESEVGKGADFRVAIPIVALG